MLREGMGQASNRSNHVDGVLDTVITNALIVDAVTGIIKADVGIKVNIVSSQVRCSDRNPSVVWRLSGVSCSQFRYLL